MRRREGDGCPIAGALQVVGDKWTMLIVRDLVNGPRRTTELITMLHPISSRTLVQRLRDMEHDHFIKRRDLGGNPPHVEYTLTRRGRLLLPFIDALRRLGESLDCNECEDRRKQRGDYCEACPHREGEFRYSPPSRRRHELDDSIVLL